MRKIMFRAWDNNKKKMVYSDDGNQEYGWFTGNDGCMICVRIEEEKDIELDNIMQYTGLNDTNERKIYEGDILYFRDENEFLDYVCWRDGCFFVTEIGEYLYEWNDACEIAGNIYEDVERYKQL